MAMRGSVERMESYAEALRLHSELGFGYVRISKRLGIPKGTVGHWLYHDVIPNRKNVGWNKGLTKETDERIKNTGFHNGHVPWNKGKHWSEESKGKMCLAKLGKHLSKEHIHRIVEANMGKKRSIEYCHRQSERMKGKPVNPKGVPLSEEHRRRISKSNKGRMGRVGHLVSEETRRKIAKTLNGHPVSEGSRLKIREKRLEQVFPVKDTLIEVALQDELRNRGIAFETHVPLLGKYQVDIFIKPNVVVECNGDYWHNLPYVFEKDQRKNEELAMADYKVFNFWEHEIKADPEHCISQMEEALTAI